MGTVLDLERGITQFAVFDAKRIGDGPLVPADRSEMASLSLDRVVRWDTETGEAETHVYGAGGFSPRSTFSLRASGRRVG